MSYEKIKKWRRVNKERMVKCFGSKCGICGYDKCINSLEFHHLDDSSKEFSITKKIVSWERAVEEVKKCVMLCSNCHREVHYGVTTISDNIRRFEEVSINYFDKDIKNTCPICQKEKHYKLKTCSTKCNGILSRKVDWDNINLDELLKQHTFTAIGKILNISGNAVKKHAKKLKLL